jgi:GNAT superfamily N-acetyltransferase
VGSEKNRQFIKRIFPFIKYRWDIKKNFDALIEFVAKSSKLIRMIGLRRFLNRLLYSRYEEMLQVIDLNKVAYPSSKGKLNVSSIERKHVPMLALLRKQAGIWGSNPAKGLEIYLDHGCKGFYAELKGEIIGYVWWGDSNSKFDFDPQGYEYYFKEANLTPSDVYGFDLFITPSHRGRGNSLEILSKYLLALRDLGYKKNYGFVAIDNIAASWVYKIIGCKDVKKVVVRRILLFFVFKNLKLFFDNNGDKWLFEM